MSIEFIYAEFESISENNKCLGDDGRKYRTKNQAENNTREMCNRLQLGESLSAIYLIPEMKAGKSFCIEKKRDNNIHLNYSLFIKQYLKIL